MTGKSRTVQMLGGLALVAGAYLAVRLIRALFLGHLTDSWKVADFVVLAAWCAYFIYVGLRFIRYGNSSEKPPTILGWGRIVLGVQLIFLILQVYFHPTPRLLEPSNPIQALGFHGGGIAIAGVGVALVVWGILKRSN